MLSGGGICRLNANAAARYGDSNTKDLLVRKFTLAILLVLAGAMVAYPKNAPMLPPGTRGFSLNVSATSFAAVELGDDVDVIVKYDSQQGAMEEQVLSKVILLAGTNTPDVPAKGIERVFADMKKRDVVNVILAVTPSEAEKLAEAIEMPNAKFSVVKNNVARNEQP
jgi:hypothetical protein